jgi:acyl carrier protein
MLVELGWNGSKDLKILSGGEALSEDLAQALSARGGSLWNLYGPTETTVWSTVWEVEPNYDRICIGRPIANTQAYVLGPSLKPVPVGVAGELYLGGDGLARGYLNRPEITAESFVNNPFSDGRGSRLYKTGDLVRYLPDGNIEYLGRIDDQVKVRGFRIEPGEIEAVLREHASVQQAVVVAREDVPGDKRLVAYVVPNLGFMLTTSELHRFLKSKLPDYMIPYAFISLDRLPIMPNGKVDRRALPAPERDRPELEESFVAARNPTEEVVAKIWGKVLGLEVVGIRDNFFDLGGHSLLAIQVLSGIRRAFAIEIPLRSLFDSPTVEELALQIAEIQARNNTAPDKVATLLANLESCSDEEAERLVPRQNA